MPKFDEAIYLPFLLKSILSGRLSNSVGGTVFYFFLNS